MSGTQKVPDEAKKKAIQAAIDGNDPYEYLNPYTENPKAMWTYIKQTVKKKDPDLYAKIPDLRDIKKPSVAEEIHVEAVKPLPVAAVFSRVMYHGMYEKKLDLANRETFRMALVSNAYDNLNLEMNAAQWKELSKEILVALDQLGVSE